MPAWVNGAGAAAVALAMWMGVGMWAGVVNLPLFRSPRPTGAWPVGSTTIAFRDPSATGSRDARVWYPASSEGAGPRVAYLDAAGSGGSLRERIVDAIVATHAEASPRVARGRFPLIVYVPGWGGGRASNTAQAENLASNGYVVVATDDTARELPLDFSSVAARDDTVVRANKKVMAGARRVERLLDEFERLDSGAGAFTGHLDVGRVGILGFSFGGAIAAEAARSDPRVVAAVDLDGWLFGDALRDGVPRDFLLIGTAIDTPPFGDGLGSVSAQRLVSEFDRDNTDRTFAGMRRYGGEFVTIDGTNHYNFTDASWLPGVRHTGVGPIDGRRGWNAIATAVLQFFDRSIKSKPAPFFGEGSPRDEVVHVRTFYASTHTAAAR